MASQNSDSSLTDLMQDMHIRDQSIDSSEPTIKPESTVISSTPATDSSAPPLLDPTAAPFHPPTAPVTGGSPSSPTSSDCPHNELYDTAGEISFGPRHQPCALPSVVNTDILGCKSSEPSPGGDRHASGSVGPGSGPLFDCGVSVSGLISQNAPCFSTSQEFDDHLEWNNKYNSVSLRSSLFFKGPLLAISKDNEAIKSHRSFNKYSLLSYKSSAKSHLLNEQNIGETDQWPNFLINNIQGLRSSKRI